MPDPQSTINHDQQATAPSSSESCEESAPEAVNSEVSLSSPLSTPHIRAIMRIPDSHVARMPALTLRELLLHGIFVDADGGLGLPMGPWPLERLVGDETTPEAHTILAPGAGVPAPAPWNLPPRRPIIERYYFINMQELREARNRLEQLEGGQCKICLEALHEPVETKCGHIFGRDCIVKVVEEQQSCPMCRYPLRSLDDVRVLKESLSKREEAEERRNEEERQRMEMEVETEPEATGEEMDTGP
ncbi:hypothetical protein PRZ48_009014 [Zasmidium cellare]|uniref:RING-type domain-containing protein n=1 Tax=Zasmidium cellare TaxID=395010 RepID=A0ABR0EH28_ZASCE|nr:hypothetical protein PRZ48_009014 [Zasmidium cellare]